MLENVSNLKQDQSKGDFVDFIASIANNEVEKSYKNVKKLESLINQGDVLLLQNWFSEIGYEVSIENCEKIISTKSNMELFKEVMNFNGGY